MGGAVCIENASSLIVSESTFNNIGSASAPGGALYVGAVSQGFTLTNSSFSGCSASVCC
jgi:hypothetical protein